MVDILQNHTKQDRPDHLPPLDPYRYQHKQPFFLLTGTSRRTSSVCLVRSSEDLLPRLGQRSEDYTAIVVEEPESYIGREVG